MPVIHKPTRTKCESFSLIENILTKKLTNLVSGILTFDFGDNFLKFLAFSDYLVTTPIFKEKSYRLIKERKLEDLTHRLQN